MKHIEVCAISEGHENPGGMMMFLAKLTQRGHSIETMKDLLGLYSSCVNVPQRNELLEEVSSLPHGTITRFAPITIAIVGASRRFLAQARTHQVGINYVSASLQYSDYTGRGRFTVPYALLKHDYETGSNLVEQYLDSCERDLKMYETIAQATDNDTAGYAMPQGLRNILVMQGNHEAWKHFIQTRACNRNTDETQYVTMLIWKELLITVNGKELFADAGPFCVNGDCREGKFCCGTPIETESTHDFIYPHDTPIIMLYNKWPLITIEEED